ncbi:MAG: cytochrome c3 family protein [Proteobacteria bacterium]|nr:cytochrome c3 family protein [Pseudomonadota bacterium]
MKKIIVVTMVVLAGVSLSATSQAVIKGSKHDLGLLNLTGDNKEICIACHAPHKADATTAAPLWNHTATTATYTMYNTNALSKTFNATITTPLGISKLCLSCHDGTVAVDSFTGHLTGSKTLTGADPGYLGTDLQKSHPISFKYNAALVATDGLTSGGTGLNDPTATPIKAWLGADGEFECSSCHDVHNTLLNTKMLNASNEGSALCLTCHKK